jgi:DNA-binding transcriptional LysR family regulator
MAMAVPAGLDPDLLRAFVLIAEEGSFTRAARLVGRTQSAVSMQVQRLEGLLGHTLLERGRGGAVRPTAHGLRLLGEARELLVVHDRIWRGFRAPAVQGTVRLGSPDDYALRYLPQILTRFAAAHPAVDVEVLCLPSGDLVPRLEAGELDLALLSEGDSPLRWPAVPLLRAPLAWITSETHAAHRRDPLPLALGNTRDSTPLSATGCVWSAAALAALEAAGLRYRVAYRSATQTGTLAPVLAGLAVTVGAASWLPPGLRAMGPGEGLPPLPDFVILLLKGRNPQQPVTDALAEHITAAFAARDATRGNAAGAAPPGIAAE